MIKQKEFNNKNASYLNVSISPPNSIKVIKTVLPVCSGRGALLKRKMCQSLFSQKQAEGEAEAHCGPPAAQQAAFTVRLI